MTTAASGCITKAEERIRDMLANCATFQTWVSAANATAAKSSIYYDAPPMPRSGEDTSVLSYNQSLRPFAVVWTGTSDGFTLNEMIGGSGVVYVRLEQDVPGAVLTNYEEADRLFKNTIGGIIHSGDTDNPGLWELSLTRQYAQITQIQLAALYHTAEDEYDTYGNAQAAELAIRWGVTR